MCFVMSKMTYVDDLHVREHWSRKLSFTDFLEAITHVCDTKPLGGIPVDEDLRPMADKIPVFLSLVMGLSLDGGGSTTRPPSPTSTAPAAKSSKGKK